MASEFAPCDRKEIVDRATPIEAPSYGWGTKA